MKVPEEILKMVPYKPGKPISETQREYGVAVVHKLASNENPLGMSPKALAAVQDVLVTLHRYPDASCYALVQKISAVWKFPRELIAVGNGSDELIDLLVRIYCSAGDSIITSEAAFVAYSVRAAASRVRTRHIPMTRDYKTDLKSIAEYISKNREKERIKIVFLPNPNNPTGTSISKNDVREFLKQFGGDENLLIVFDEAYTEFVRSPDYESAQGYLHQYDNVIVLKTLSKVYGLAGLRVGIMLAPASTIDVVNRVRTPFNVNELAQVAATAALDDFDFIRASCEATWQGLDYFYQELKALGLPYIESQANFVMFDTLRDVKEVDVALLKRGVILRPLVNYGFKSHMRLSVGMEAENHIAIRALQSVLKEIPQTV